MSTQKRAFLLSSPYQKFQLDFAAFQRRILFLKTVESVQN